MLFGYSIVELALLQDFKKVLYKQIFQDFVSSKIYGPYC